MLATLLVAPMPAEASSAWLDAEQRFTDLVNEERNARGLPPVAINLQMVRIARDWSDTMAAEDRLYHRPHLDGEVFGPWEGLAENVGKAGHSSTATLASTVDRLHQAFMDSPGHRANVLGDFNQLGVGVVVGSGKMWATFNFLRGPVGDFPLFEDIAGNAHEVSIERAWVGDLAQGCQFSRYCGAGSVNRAQMATFLARALGLKPIVSDRFVDVDPGSIHAGAINALAEAGIVAGCATDRYCPAGSVSRAQMATFLGRALDLEPSYLPAFIDVPPTSPHFGYVNAVAEADITSGCDVSSLRYCPGDHVRRAQMASFLARAFDTPTPFWTTSGTEGGRRLALDAFL